MIIDITTAATVACPVQAATPEGARRLHPKF